MTIQSDTYTLVGHNHLGSPNERLDRSQSGRGIVLRRDDGQLVEASLTTDSSDNTIWEFTDIDDDSGDGEDPGGELPF